MSKEIEKAEWRRRQAIKTPAPRVLHTSKEFITVKTETLPVTRFKPGRTFMNDDALADQAERREARQRRRDERMIARANRMLDSMKDKDQLAKLTKLAEDEALD